MTSMLDTIPESYNDEIKLAINGTTILLVHVVVFIILLVYFMLV